MHHTGHAALNASYVPNAHYRLPGAATHVVAIAVIWGCLGWGCNILQAQPASEEMVELNLAGSVSLTKLVEAVSRQIDIRFLYSADLANRQVTVYTPAQLPQERISDPAGQPVERRESGGRRIGCSGLETNRRCCRYGSLCTDGRGRARSLPVTGPPLR